MIHKKITALEQSVDFFTVGHVYDLDSKAIACVKMIK